MVPVMQERNIWPQAHPTCPKTSSAAWQPFPMGPTTPFTSLICTYIHHVTSNATSLCQSTVTSLPFFCPSVGGCVVIYEFLAPQEGTMSSAPGRWIPSHSQSTSVGTALQDTQLLNSRMFFVHWYLEGKSIQMQSGVFSITSAAKDIKKESFSPWKGHVVM